MQTLRWVIWIPHLYEKGIDPYQPKYPAPKKFSFNYNPRSLEGEVEWIEREKAFKFKTTSGETYTFGIADFNPQVGCILLEGYNINLDKYILEHPFSVKIKEFYHRHRYHSDSEKLDGLLPAVVLGSECWEIFNKHYWCDALTIVYRQIVNVIAFHLHFHQKVRRKPKFVKNTAGKLTYLKVYFHLVGDFEYYKKADTLLTHLQNAYLLEV
ncbi:MAG: hypothetical protein DSZ31_05065 [Gammaproteobacteria bacterium]|nr:MAG: hypothetical protein DSZ31_05065 [Gammaproteobacteria bacterium]